MPERSAEAVRRLERAGYANVGKSRSCIEFAYGVTSRAEPPPRDGAEPACARTHLRGRAAAPAAALRPPGLADAALGTDSGGSIRIPAACCAIVSFKPSCGLKAGRRRVPARAELRPRRPAARDVSRLCRALPAPSPRKLWLPTSTMSHWRIFASASPGANSLREPSRTGRASEVPPVRCFGDEAEVDRASASRPGRSRCSCARWGTFTATSTPSTATSAGENILAEDLSSGHCRRRRGGGRRRGPGGVRRAGGGGAPAGPGPAPDPDASGSFRHRPTSDEARDARGLHPLHLPVQRARLARAGAPVRASAELPGLPASLQIVGRPGDDDARARVAAQALETALNDLSSRLADNHGVSRYLSRWRCLRAMLILCPQAVGPPSGSSTCPGICTPSSGAQTSSARGDHTYARGCPPFAWNPIAGAKSYELQLAGQQPRSATSSVLYERCSTLTAPVASIQLQVRRMTGDPYALWVHRQEGRERNDHWLEQAVRLQLRAGRARRHEESSPTGLIRWSPSRGRDLLPGHGTRASTASSDPGFNGRRRARVLDVSIRPAGIIRWRVRRSGAWRMPRFLPA